ncbi:hypothetical protein M513_09656 [Trichuris suis]|uniref:Uncharacterized protein n=1 Tax=Trichuris suis TaxID=68888 RepID=A0A085LWX5_9BILA|nr:hypothetical protein M513_09656 [Trichuris suis]
MEALLDFGVSKPSSTNRLSPGVVADACNPATWRLGTEDGLRPGVLDRITSRRPSVRIKSGVNMVTIKELAVTRLVKEGRNWPRAETQQAKVPASLQWWDSACE